MEETYSTELWHSWTTTLNKSPNKLALIDLEHETEFTRRELHCETEIIYEKFAKDLSGHIVAFCLPNSLEWIAFFLALQKAGAIALPLDITLKPSAQLRQASTLNASYLWNGRNLELVEHHKRHRNPYVLVKLTSGSTGDPKPILCKASHMIADGQQIINTMGIKTQDCNLGLIPFGHSYGLGNLIMPLILQGTSIAIATEFVPSQIPEWLQTHKITIFPTVPSIVQILSASPSVRELQPLRKIISAGAPLTPKTAEEFHRKFSIHLHNFYGSSETGGICYDCTGEATLTGRAIGTPLKGVHIQIKKGRVEVTSPAVAMPKGKALLNDLAEWNQEGELKVTGRHGEIVNIGGKKIHPHEIVNTLQEIDGVGEAWVGTLHTKGRGHLIAAIESSLNESTIIKQLQERLPDWKLPRQVKILSTLPRTERGKLDRKAIQALFTL